MPSPFWCCAQLKPQRSGSALYFLRLAGFEVYYPQICELRIVRQRRLAKVSPLFPGYAFVLITLQWSAALYAPGVHRLVLDGGRPARVPDRVIDAIRCREHGGFVELPKKPQPRRGDAMRIV